MDILKEFVPEAHKVLTEQNRVVMKDGALSTRVKELMAIPLSIAVRCEPCLKIHIDRAIEAGATEEEIAEALAVVTLMCGGPAYVWSKRIFDEKIKTQSKAIK